MLATKRVIMNNLDHERGFELNELAQASIRNLPTHLVRAVLGLQARGKVENAFLYPAITHDEIQTAIAGTAARPRSSGPGQQT